MQCSSIAMTGTRQNSKAKWSKHKTQATNAQKGKKEDQTKVEDTRTRNRSDKRSTYMTNARTKLKDTRATEAQLKATTRMERSNHHTIKQRERQTRAWQITSLQIAVGNEKDRHTIKQRERLTWIATLQKRTGQPVQHLSADQSTPPQRQNE